ncbi:hypothetical protein FGO68_gene9904 [Halteria grandinella]|uniref:Uncharacterized protein n=1 Tax=Halteria grandinella TaxID=5974 RepID=A0A8J8SYB9_HALGN|nr:hypothetical protein FGO68_gene9904 [Halteria grandinella]
MQDLIQIYSGCPLKFYFGDRRYKEFKHFYHLTEAKQLVDDIFAELTKLADKADAIYETLIEKDSEKDVVTVDSMLGKMQSKNAIQDQCIELFGQKPSKKEAAPVKSMNLLGLATEGEGAAKQDEEPAKSVVVDKKKFRKWWIEAKRNQYESIKYYLIGWMGRQLASSIKKEQEQPSDSLKAMTENLGELIEGQTSQPVEEKKKEKPLAAALLKATKKQPQQSEKASGTQFEARTIFFPDFESDDQIRYFKRLHTFEEDDDDLGWVSFGFKPKAKDLKTFLEDLYEFDYFDTLEDELEISHSIVLDGRKVRIGLESKIFNIFHEECPLMNKGKHGYNDYEEDFVELIRVIEDEKKGEVIQPAIFEVKLDLGNKLADILLSHDPMIVGLFKNLKFEMNMKLHASQYAKILENTTEMKYKKFFGQKEGEAGDGEKKEEEGGPKEDDKSEKGSSKKSGSDDQDEEEEDDDEYGDDDDEEKESGASEFDGSHKNDALGIRQAFTYLLPFFMFQWDTEATLKPDLDDIREYCKDQKQFSHLFNSFKEYIQRTQDAEFQLHDDKKQQTFIKKGSKAEVMNYLIHEVGQEIEFIWKTKHFYMQGQIKTEDLGSVLRLLSKGELI